MRTIFFLLSLTTVGSITFPVAAYSQTATAIETFPQAEISNGILQTRFYLPDTAKGYYRGSRFDWSGVMPALTYKGHSYSGQWFDHYEPTLHDAIMGPVESFDPIGFEKTSPAGSFVAIGIGVLAKGNETTYSPFRYYRLLQSGSWIVKRHTNRLDFRQSLRDSTCSYVYEKSVELAKNSAKLVIRHRLKNTGLQPIEANVYNHNLMMLDNDPVGPELTLSFPFKLTAINQRRIGTIADIRDRQIVFLQNPVIHEDVYAILEGYGDSPEDYTIRMENQHTGAGVRITCDRPLSKLVFWSCSTVACPEPYIHVKAGPGETFTWTLSYEFYEISANRK